MSKSLIGKFMLGMTVIVGAVLAATLLWDLTYYQEEVDQDLQLKADVVALQIMATRSFIARMSEPGAGQELHPTEVSKGAGALFAHMAESTVKETRLVVRDGKNQPDDFEREALLAFMADPTQTVVYGRSRDENGKPIFRYVAAVRADAACLKCHGEPKGQIDKTGHAKEGYKEGDVAGAISVTLPMAEALNEAQGQAFRMAGTMLLVAALTLALIWFILLRQVSTPLRQLAGVAESVGRGHMRVEPDDLAPLYANKETSVVADAFAAMTHRLEDLYAGLEQKVADRTAQLQAANVELERASRHKSEFLTMVSHEFRTPLTSIITFTELLLDSAAGQINQEQQEYLNDVLESSTRLLQMINDLLDLSRLDAGKIRLFFEAVALSELVRDTELTVRPLVEKAQLTMAIDVPDSLPLVRVDPLRVRQVLLNLLGNAVKFTPPGGALSISARPCEGYLIVGVCDSGVGIALEDQERIFEKFSQAGRERPEGTGLGLPLARSLVELHGGQMWVESRVGVGSTFWFTLPLCSEEGRMTQHDASQADSRS